MDQSWYIPRPSLSSNSSKVQSRFYHRDSEVLEKTKDCNDCNTTHSSVSSQNSSTQRSKINNNKKNQTQETCIDNIECDSPIKRGSRSSQGSSDSEQSIHSASSLLLTVANLENFAKIQERHHASSILDNFEKIHKQNQSSIIYIHPNNLFAPHYNISTKELDQLSMASSTHFTMINGFGRSSMKRKSKSFICKRSRQVTVLIITMSFLFIIGLSIAVILIELRNREMPR